MMMSSSTSEVRLADVARSAGVSVVTVSRALRMPEKVAPETRARVDAAVRDLGYVPNLLAGALASARTRTVGILVPTLASAIFATTINGLTDALEREGYAILVAQSGYDADRELTALGGLLGHRPEGAVLVGSPLSDPARKMLQGAKNRGTTVVETWDLPRDPVGAVVGFDNRAVGAAVATRFAKAGRRRLAFLGGTDRRAAARWSGFASAAKKCGLARPHCFELPSPSAIGDAFALIQKKAASAQLAKVDAIFAATDLYAIGVLGALSGIGRRVPDDVAVVGLGDLDIARFTTPPLSTVRIDGSAMGRAAADMILKRAKDFPERSDAESINLGFDLIERRSG